MDNELKHELRQEAKDLYFHSILTKTQIAEKVGITRKTLLFWSRQGDWDKLKQAALHTPALVAEKCYYLIDQYTSTLLTDGMGISNLTLRHAQTIHLLASTIRKIKNRSTVNESMEMFNFFLSGLSRRDPTLAEQVRPQIEEFIECRANNEVNDYLMDGFNEDGTMPYPDKEITEQQQDKKDYEEMQKEFEQFLESRNSRGGNSSGSQFVHSTDPVSSGPAPHNGYSPSVPAEKVAA